MNQHFLASVIYLSAMIDGEGSLHPNKAPGFTIQVTNAHFGLIYRLQDTFGGSVTFERQPKTPNRQKMAQWRVCAQPSIRQILLWTRPYLIVKQPQANLILDYFERFPHAGSGMRISAEQREAFLVYRRQLQVLNGRIKPN